MVNKVTIIGHLGAAPEVRRTESGVAVAKLNIATSENYKDANGDWKTITEWHKVILWRKLAEAAEEKRKKGDLVYIEGKLVTRKWKDNNGIDRWSTEIVGAYLRNIPRQSNSSQSMPSDADAPPPKEQRKEVAETPIGNPDDLPF